MSSYSSASLARQLEQSQPPNASFLDVIKIRYRPYICPFDDILDLIPDRSAIFDIGCGSGQLLYLIQANKNPKRVKGIEIKESLINNANALFQEKVTVPFDFGVYDGEQIPVEINGYDVVTMVDVFHHIPTKLQWPIMQQIFQNMRPGAILVFKDIDAASFLVWFNKLHDLFLGGGPGDEVSMESAIQEFRKLGFELETSMKKRMLWYPHFTLVLRKPLP